MLSVLAFGCCQVNPPSRLAREHVVGHFPQRTDAAHSTRRLAHQRGCVFLREKANSMRIRGLFSYRKCCEHAHIWLAVDNSMNGRLLPAHGTLFAANT